jgi:hypothetical protein
MGCLGPGPERRAAFVSMSGSGATRRLQFLRASDSDHEQEATMDSVDREILAVEAATEAFLECARLYDAASAASDAGDHALAEQLAASARTAERAARKHKRRALQLARMN